MSDNQIGPAFMIALGVAFAIYGSDQLVQAYHVEPFGKWSPHQPRAVQGRAPQPSQ